MKRRKQRGAVVHDGCTGKRRHRNKRGASIHIRKLKEPGMQAYLCSKCGGWHIGHRDRIAGIQARLDRLIGPDPVRQAASLLTEKTPAGSRSHTKSSGSLKHPFSAPTAPKNGQRPLKSPQTPLKSPVSALSHPAKPPRGERRPG